MKHLVLVLLAGAWASSAAPVGYYKLKLVKIVDTQGFGQPVEVLRLLLPADWRVESGVHWDQSQLHCPLNIVKISLGATSPDGLSAVEIGPGYTWTSASDPMMQQILRQSAANRTGCDVGPVTGAVDYLRGSVAPRQRPGARIVSSEALPAVSQAKQALLAPSLDPLVRAGIYRGYRADAGSVRLAYAQAGQPVEEWIMASVVSIASSSANTAALMQGQMNRSASTYSMISEGTLSLRMPAGRFDQKLLATILASIRPNPQYQAAVGQFLANMNQIANRGAMERARLWHEAGQQISATISQTYRMQQATQDRVAAQFSQTIRGVETYLDAATGARVELSGGYDNAWVNARGEYLLSDSPGFNPAVALREEWRQLNKTQ